MEIHLEGISGAADIGVLETEIISAGRQQGVAIGGTQHVGSPTRIGQQFKVVAVAGGTEPDVQRQRGEEQRVGGKIRVGWHGDQIPLRGTAGHKVRHRAATIRDGDGRKGEIGVGEGELQLPAHERDVVGRAGAVVQHLQLPVTGGAGADERGQRLLGLIIKIGDDGVGDDNVICAVKIGSHIELRCWHQRHRRKLDWCGRQARVLGEGQILVIREHAARRVSPFGVGKRNWILIHDDS